MLTLRSLLFYLFYSITLVLYSIPCVLIGPFFTVKKRYSFFLFWGSFAQWWLRISCNIRCEITGHENVPPGTFIVMSNHQSPWETIFFYDYFRPLCAILKKELLSIPFFGWGLALLNPIAIDRSKRRTARKMVLEQGKQRLASGISVLIFPEGTRVKYGEQKRFSVSGAELAIGAQATIVPVAHNAGKFWPAKKLIKYPGVIRVVIGEAIDTRGRDPRELTDQIQAWVHATLNDIEQEQNSH